MGKWMRMAVVLVLVVALLGCQKEDQGQQIIIADVEPTASYDWMAGVSPVSNERIGVVRAGFQGPLVTVSPTGVYFIPQIDNWTSQRFILYVDHGSDQVIKLCGRADCTHDNDDCNASIYSPSALSFYNGHLYVWGSRETSIGTTMGNEPQRTLWKMDPDGTNWVEVLDLEAFREEKYGKESKATFGAYMITNGYVMFTAFNKVENDKGELENVGEESYLYRLDGSDGPKLNEIMGMPLYRCGDVMLTLRNEVQNGGEYGSYWDHDWEKDTITYLTDHPGEPGWYGKEEGYYFRDGAIRRLTYATQTEEVMVDTGLEGDYYVFCVPDCLIVAARDESDDALYFYNWAFELVDTVTLDYPHKNSTEFLILAETADRIILTDGDFKEWPRYYIEKSELGSGNVEVHAYDLSAVEEAQQET